MDAQEGAAPDGHEHPDVLQNQTPNAISSAFSNATLFLQAYGWFVVFGVIALAFVYNKLKPHLERQKQRYQQGQEYRNYDPEETRRRQEAIEASRRRLQETHDAESDRFKEAQIKREEAKRQEKIEDWQRHQEGKGYRSRVRTPDDQSGASGSSQSKPKKNVYKTPDYSPLGGGGGGAGYRPSRRSGGG